MSIKLYRNPLDTKEVEVIEETGNIVDVLAGHGVGFKGKIIYRNGDQTDSPFNVLEEDKVEVYQKLTEPISTAVTAIGAFFAKEAVVGIFAIFSVGSAIAQAYKARRARKGIDSGSAYSDIPFEVNFREGEVIPVVYGEHRVSGTMLTRVLDRGANRMTVLMLLSQGEIESVDTSTIMLDQQPLSDFGANAEASLGTATQSTLSGIAPGGLETLLFERIPYVISVNPDLEGTFQSAPSSVTFRVNIRGRGVTAMVSISIYKTVGNTRSFVTTRAFSHTTTMDEETVDWVRTIPSVDVNATYSFELRNLSPDVEMYLYSYIEMPMNFDASYPNRALLIIRGIDTTRLQGSLSQISVMIKGKKIMAPVIEDSTGTQFFDERIYYDGTNYRTFRNNTQLRYRRGLTGEIVFHEQFTRNPIWIINDIITNARYGAEAVIGEPLINRDDLVEEAEYCDTLYNNNKRFRMDFVIDSSEELGSLLAKLLLSINGFFYYSGGLKIGIEKPITTMDVVQYFSDTLNQRGKTPFSNITIKTPIARERYASLRLDFFNRGLDYKESTVIRNGPTRIGSYRNIRAFVTEPTVANYLVNLYYNQGVIDVIRTEFTVDIHGFFSEVGDIVVLDSDIFKQFRQINYTTGRVVRAEGRVLEIDSDININRADISQYRVTLVSSDPNIADVNANIETFSGRTLYLTSAVSNIKPFSTIAHINVANRLDRQRFFRILSITRVIDEERYQVEAVEVRNDIFPT